MTPRGSVAVVGAGPAGSFCAERLARAGFAVTIYDPSHPREKPCGGGVTPGVFAQHPELAGLRSLGRPSHAVRLRAPGGSLLRVPIARPIDVFSRRVLDQALLERALAAGATLAPLRVARVRVGTQTAEVETGGAWQPHDFVVGADGAASVVRRSLLGARPGGPHGYATAGFCVEGLREAELYVEFVPDYAGYLWVFPRPDHVSAGIAAPLRADNGHALKHRVLAMLEERYPGSLELPRCGYAASIPVATPRDAAGASLGGARFALIGDAAALPDAITGEGIHYAIDSAAELARAIDEAGPVGAGEVYARRWQRGAGRELARAAWIARRLYRPRGVDLALSLGRHSRRVRGVIGDMLTVMQPYSTLGRRLLREALRPREAAQLETRS